MNHRRKEILNKYSTDEGGNFYFQEAEVDLSLRSSDGRYLSEKEFEEIERIKFNFSESISDEQLKAVKYFVGDWVAKFNTQEKNRAGSKYTVVRPYRSISKEEYNSQTELLEKEINSIEGFNRVIVRYPSLITMYELEEKILPRQCKILTE